MAELLTEDPVSSRNELMAAILQFIRFFGPLHPTGTAAYSLWGWTMTILEIRALRDLAKHCNDFRTYLPNEIEESLAEIENEWEEKITWALKMLGADEQAGGAFLPRFRKGLSLIKKEEGCWQAREGLAEQLLQDFWDEVKGSNSIRLREDGLHVFVCASAWASYELAEIFRSGKALRICEGCGLPFLPHDKRQKYCTTSSSRCRTRKMRRDKRVKRDLASIAHKEL